MNHLQRLSIALASVFLSLSVDGQMSTFPSPPPLAPPSASTANSGGDGASVPASGAPSLDSPGPAQDNGSKPNATENPDESTKASSKTEPVVAATLNSMSALDDKVPLQDGDKISYRVLEDEDDAVSRTVTDTGEAEFPYIGRVKVEGKTCHEVALEVKKMLEVNYYKEATVIVGLDEIAEEDKQKPKDMVWVVGEVREVGPVELSSVQPLSVSQAILRAGGFGDFADQSRVKVIHRGAKATGSQPPNVGDIKDAQVVNVGDVFAGKPAPDPTVRPGDYIIVPKVFIKFY
jgi:protein involved in polysaccharide export with SLBB domain